MSSRQNKIQNYIHELTEKIISENLFEEICVQTHQIVL